MLSGTYIITSGTTSCVSQKTLYTFLSSIINLFPFVSQINLSETFETSTFKVFPFLIVNLHRLKSIFILLILEYSCSHLVNIAVSFLFPNILKLALIPKIAVIPKTVIPIIIKHK